MAGHPDRLHALDAVWLEMEGDGAPIAIGTVAVVEGPTPTVAQVRAHLAGRMARMPRLHQVLAHPRAGMRRPAWQETGHVDLAAHVHRCPPGRTGSTSPLDEAVGRIMEQPLPHDRPLWDAWVVRLPAGQWALVWRVHHAIADGLAALALLGEGFDLHPDGGPTLGDAIRTGARPPVEQGRSGAAAGSGGPARAQAGVHARPPAPAPAPAAATPASPASPLDHLVSAVSAVGAAVPHLAPALGALVPHPPSRITGRVGARRAWRSVDVPFEEVSRAGRVFGATVNDVVLAGVAGGFRSLLASRGELVAESAVVRNLVPVSTRAAGDARANNEISAVLGHLPVGIGDPVARLHAVHDAVGHARAAGTPAAASLLLGAVDRIVPAFVQDVAVATAGRTAPAWFFDTLTTNVPGPRFPVYLMGGRVRGMYPVIPVAGHTALTTGIFSYDGTLNIGVTADPAVAADVDVLALGIRDAIAELAALAGAPSG